MAWDSYDWNTGAETQSIQVTQTGTYTVTVTRGNCTASESITVTQSTGQATADFDYTENGLTVDFTAIGNGINFVSWDFGDGNTSFDENPTHTYAEAGTYTVTLTITDVCGQTADKSITITVGPQSITENHELAAMRIFPNPTSGEFAMEFEQPLTENVQLELLDVTGKLIISEQLTTGTQKSQWQWNALPNGIYQLKLGNSKGVATHRLVVA